jgi:flagellar L-ring protein precursor FlgH
MLHHQPNRAALFLACLNVLAFGATTRVKADPPADPPPQTPTGLSIPFGMAVERNGGSLYKTELANRPAPSPTDAKPPGPPGSAAAVSFFTVADQKPKGFKKHDLITIIAKEQSASTSNGKSNLTKTQDYDTKLNSFIVLHPSKDSLSSIISGGSNVPEINIANSRDYNGTGEVDRTDTFSDRVTAEVVDVKPNGTLVLQAVKEIKTDEEEQRMILTGICRAEDIAADNTVLTTQLFDLNLNQTHTGAVTDTTKRGLLPRLLDTFSPF